MEGFMKNFTVDIADQELVIGKIDCGQKKILHFKADEALMLLEVLKDEESHLKQIAKEEKSIQARDKKEYCKDQGAPLFKMPDEIIIGE